MSNTRNISILLLIIMLSAVWTESQANTFGKLFTGFVKKLPAPAKLSFNEFLIPLVPKPGTIIAAGTFETSVNNWLWENDNWRRFFPELDQQFESRNYLLPWTSETYRYAFNKGQEFREKYKEWGKEKWPRDTMKRLIFHLLKPIEICDPLDPVSVVAGIMDSIVIIDIQKHISQSYSSYLDSPQDVNSEPFIVYFALVPTACGYAADYQLGLRYIEQFTIGAKMDMIYYSSIPLYLRVANDITPELQDDLRFLPVYFAFSENDGNDMKIKLVIESLADEFQEPKSLLEFNRTLDFKKNAFRSGRKL
ncbi:MAG: hypothetical protein GY841_14065 [FCB group bacterium]|nr:hypothetical protein [FCB group bacterium]